MGLAIYTTHTDKDIHWGYHTLHIVRDLALQSCGVNKELCSIIRSCYSSKVDIVRFLMAYHPEIEIKSSDFAGMQLAGYYYPNLLFHSDCEGDYTYRGRVMTDKYWQRGNIKQLKNELENLLESSEDIDNNSAKQFTQEFYDLVKAECESSKYPRIYFC